METFNQIPFPINGNIVYIVGIAYKSNFLPFYIGQSTTNIGRFGYYISANFSAQTDFKVGEAVKYLIKMGYEVVIKYKESENRIVEERELISRFQRDYPLLNFLQGYNYRTADKEQEKEKIYKYVDFFLKEVIPKSDQ